MTKKLFVPSKLVQGFPMAPADSVLKRADIPVILEKEFRNFRKGGYRLPRKCYVVYRRTVSDRVPEKFRPNRCVMETHDE